MEPSEGVLRGLLAGAPDALLAVDSDGRIVFVSDQVELLFGWSRADLIGERVECLVPELLAGGHPSLRAGFVGHPATRLMGAGRQILARRKDGCTFLAEISLSAVTDAAGSVLVLAAIRDVTDRMEVQAGRQRQALAAQREQSHRLESLGQLAGGVAHDFNNLLGVILNYNTLVARRVTDPVALADLEEIRAAAERAAALTRQLLTFARQGVASPEPVDVNDVVRGGAPMLERTLGEQVELLLDLAIEPLVVIADRHQLDEIVLTLATNGRDSMVDGGKLTIATEYLPRASEALDADLSAAGDVVLRVIDTGHGMESDVVARAFEPFFTTKPRGQGAGLGLATVYGIVSQNGGKVTIDSTVSVGTTVTVVLRGADDAVRADATRAEASRGGLERILLVEDEPSLRLGTARVLGERGYEVLVASDGLEALEIFDREEGAFDVLVTDVAMPRMRGDELANQLAERTSHPPVIFMTGYDSPDTIPLFGRLLTKPVAEDVLLRAIREVLGG
jgi:PAS domain S-box-containing protein